MAIEEIEVPNSMRPIVKSLAIGVDDNYIDQLVDKSKQLHIVKSTPNDASRRFPDRTAFRVWYGSNHIVHWLIGDSNDLAGMIWYTVKKYPLDTYPLNENPTETFAIRLYEGYIGHHLAVPFMKFSLHLANKKKNEQNSALTDMWLQTTPDNLAAIASYVKLGYKETFRDEHKVIMTIKAQDLEAIARDSI